MKKIITFSAALFFISQVFGAALPVAERVKAEDVMIPIGKTGKALSLLKLSTISLKELQEVTGEKLKFSGKIAFKFSQRQLRRTINEDGTIDQRKLEKALKKGFFESHPFHLGGFALGFFLSFIGVLVAYLIKDDLKSDRVSWAWRGLLASLAIGLAIARAVAG